MQLQARAKLNWTLDITGKRKDNYHLLDMLVSSLDLCDTLTFEPSEGLSLSIINAPHLSAGDDNLVLKAARALIPYASKPVGAHITLQKNIPSRAGLGGGSTDAAATLRALNALWGLNLPMAELMRVALPLGADVPYCLMGGDMRVRGIGERINPITVSQAHPLILLKPCDGLDTHAVFSACDALPIMHPDTAAAQNALKNGDIGALQACGQNALLPAAIQLAPCLSEAMNALRASGAKYVQMTGSGCVVYGVYQNNAAQQSAYAVLQKQYDTAILTHTVHE